MMNIKIFSLLSTLILLNIACAPKQEEAQNTASSAATSTPSAIRPTGTDPTPATTTAGNSVGLVNTYWKLTQLNDKEITVSENQREPHIVFNAENRISGSDGCNRMMGSYTLDGDNLSLGELAGTRMACMDGAEQADAFNKTLTKVTAYNLQGDALELHDDTGSVIARFKAVALP